MSSLTKATQPPPPPQWVLDYATPALPKPKNNSVPDPPGFTSAVPSGKKGSSKQPPPAPRKAPTPEEMDMLKLKKSWEVALAPAKQLPMNAIGMWMTGNSLQIFSIFMVFTLFRGPLTALISIGSTFSRFETPGIRQQLVMVKLVYVATNLLALSLGIYKIHKMGLLPTTRSDWLAWETQRMPLERAYPAA